MSAPAILKYFAIMTASSGVMPPSTQSWVEILTEIGSFNGQTSRMALKTSNGYLSRAFKSPPYSSVLWLVSGEIKEDSK